MNEQEYFIYEFQTKLSFVTIVSDISSNYDSD